ncbi:MAG: hypothetical protein QOF21_2617 [Actinomycetota bacterium]|jgi:hypothetical protein
MMRSVIDDFAGAALQWQEQGWALLEGLVPTADIDAVGGDLDHLYGTDTFADYNKAKGSGEFVAPDGKAFREQQFDGMRGFPFGGSGALNDLFVHPRVLEFVRSAMQSDDIRIYQAAVWKKNAGEVSYEQPLHQDGNHSLVPPRMEPGFWHLEGFLFLSDVDEDSAPPKLVPNTARTASTPYKNLYKHEVAATGKRGTFLAYRSDVWHRGTDFGRPDASRVVMVISFKLGGQEWFGYDAFPRLGSDGRFSKFLAGKTPDDLALFGIPRPGHPYWNDATIEAMAQRHRGLDMSPWRGAITS